MERERKREGEKERGRERERKKDCVYVCVVQVPKTCENFLKLCSKGYYKQTGMYVCVCFCLCVVLRSNVTAEASSNILCCSGLCSVQV